MDGHAGRLRLKNGGKASELDVACMCVAGTLAEQRALGQPERVNWFAEDMDTQNAIKMVDTMVEAGDFNGDVFEARHWVEVRARSLLASKWRAIQALAEKLRVHSLLTGDEIAEVLKGEGVRPHGELSKAEARRSTLTTQLAEVEQEIAEIKAQLDQPDDDPSLWPLRKKLASLHHKRQELIAQ